jgi:hypothetical protein
MQMSGYIYILRISDKTEHTPDSTIVPVLS